MYDLNKNLLEWKNNHYLLILFVGTIFNLLCISLSFDSIILIILFFFEIIWVWRNMHYCGRWLVVDGNSCIESLRQAVQFPPVQWTSKNKYFIQIGYFFHICYYFLNPEHVTMQSCFNLCPTYPVYIKIKNIFVLLNIFTYLPTRPYPYVSMPVTVKNYFLHPKRYQKCHIFM